MTLGMIGASMVEAMVPQASNPLNATTNDSSTRRDGSDDAQRLPLPSHAPSFIEKVLMVDDSVMKDAKHVFLHGPQKSGVSSLLLELACSLAAQTPCRCSPSRAGRDRSASSPSSSSSASFSSSSLSPSRGVPCSGCTAVLIFRPARNREECDPFPIPCQSLDAKQSGEEDENSDWAGDKRASTPSPVLLRRVQIHHVGSVRDMFRTLLQVQGWEMSKRPFGGILVDDFHRIVSESHPEARGLVGPAISTPNLLLGAKLLALLVDTARALHHETLPPFSHGGAGELPSVDATPRRTPAYLVVATHAPPLSPQGGMRGGGILATTAVMGPAALNMWTHFWRPAILELSPVSHPSSHFADCLKQWISNQRLDQDFPLGTLPVSHYEAKVRCNTVADLGASSHLLEASHSYAVFHRKTNEGDGSILWMVYSGCVVASG